MLQPIKTIERLKKKVPFFDNNYYFSIEKMNENMYVPSTYVNQLDITHLELFSTLRRVPMQYPPFCEIFLRLKAVANFYQQFTYLSIQITYLYTWWCGTIEWFARANISFFIKHVIDTVSMHRKKKVFQYNLREYINALDVTYTYIAKKKKDA